MNHPYWNYFLSIDSDLAQCERFVEFSDANFHTYSIEFARIIMAASSEFDNVARALCKKISPEKAPVNITQYYPIIIGKYPKFLECEVLLPRYNISIKPWKKWTDTNAPDWWSKGYNKIKHERDSYFDQANLENAISSTAGLFVGILYYYDSCFGKSPNIDVAQLPKLFDLQDYNPINSSSISWTYDIPK